MGLLWVIGAALIIVGIWKLIDGNPVLGIILIVLGLIIGPWVGLGLRSDDTHGLLRDAALTARRG